MRLLALIAAVLMLCADGAFAQAQTAAPGVPALDRLQPDQLSINVTAGYSGYALPVANFALGRKWAAERGHNNSLAWQIGRNLSVIPVRIDILHRMPRAFTGRVEIVSAHGYAREEDPLGHITYCSQDLLIPPSVPTTIVLAVRACPLSAPGMPARLSMRLFAAGSAKPVQVLPLSVTQLEPYYVYSLYLDGPPDAIYADPVNRGNALKLQLAYDPQIDEAFYASGNFTLTAEHKWVTKLPLAARDFAFIFADLAQVRAWPEDEQAALAAFVVGGGHLCLFNATSPGWRGIGLQAGAQEVGRGRLLPVAGGFDTARGAVAKWLAGEIEELVLWLGGSSDGVRLLDTDAAQLRQSGLDLTLSFAQRDQTGAFVSHRPGYLNPIWIYRETCLSGALEPWDFPEFVLADQDVAANNPGLSLASRQTAQERLNPLANYTEQQRRFTPGALSVMLIVLGAGLARGLRRPRSAGVLMAVLALGGAGAWWWCAKAQPGCVQSVQLIDQDARCTASAASRNLLAARSGTEGSLQLSLPPDPVVRRVNWEQPGAWEVAQGRQQTTLKGWDGQGYLSLVTDARYTFEGPQRVSAQAVPVGGSRYRITADTSGVAAGTYCVLLYRSGLALLPGGRSSVTVEIEQPPAPVEPGFARLRAVAQAVSGPRGVDRMLGVARGENLLALRDLLNEHWASQVPGETALALPERDTVWAGLLQQPQEQRGMLGNQAVLLAPLPASAKDTAANTHMTRILRLTLPLGGGS